MSNKLFQGMMYQMRDAVDREIGILDDKGIVIACSKVEKMGSEHRVSAAAESVCGELA